LDRAALERSLGFTLRPRNVLVTFHPTTLDATPPTEQFDALGQALAALGPDVGVILTRPNADGDGRALFERIDALVEAHPNMRAYTSLGQLRYLSAMAACDAVVGNSSSGLYEAPSLGRPTVNIGDRQRGRLQAASVLDCPPEASAIEATIRRAFTLSCAGVVNPYGDGHAAERIVAVLRGLPDPRALLQKRFFLLP
ncbi:MAG: UDP-N-acetylglucosamine 2-epimerase (hydrolyzing), partial [Myxococcales bacterium]